MQAAAQTQVVCPKPTDEQVKAQIENMKWQEKENTLANAFGRQNATASMQIQHQQFMAERLTGPLVQLATTLIFAFVIVFLGLKFIAASIVKNRDDNESAERENRDNLAAGKKSE